MSTPPSGSDPNYAQEGSPTGQPGWGPPQGQQPGWGPPQGEQPGYGSTQGQGHGQPQGYGPGQGQGYEQGRGYEQGQGYEPAPTYSGSPAGYGAAAGGRPGMVTAAGIVGIVWGALALLFGLLAIGFAFAISGLLGLIVLVTVVVGIGLLVGGIYVVTGKSPKLLLYISYAAIAINVIELIISLAQGGSAASGVLGFLLPGVIVALLLQPQSKQYYASRGLSY